jgi:thiosulfate/3-mercaptopyruvate sulfurtransferase
MEVIKMKNLVNCNWLKENITNENFVIVDCRFDLMKHSYGKESYDNGHIPGAFFMDMEKDLASKVKEHGGRHPFPDLNELKEKLENIGIGNNTTVIAYDDGDLAGAARFWMLLRYIGHNKIYILNGGIKAWNEEGYELSLDRSVSNSRGILDININEDMLVKMEEVKEKLNKTNVVIVDAREEKRYNGEVEPIDKKPGHIPGALNYFWMEVLNSNNDKLKTLEELEKHFEDLNNYDEVILYCGSGLTTTVNSLALDELGIKHKVYAGSYSDWVSYDDNEVETNLHQ